MEHTQGSWRVSPYAYRKRGKVYTRPAAVIAGNNWICSEVMGHDFQGSSIANATLIAGAPDLLKELRGALPYLEDAADAGSFKALEQLQSARAVIEKATNAGGN